MIVGRRPTTRNYIKRRVSAVELKNSKALKRGLL